MFKFLKKKSKAGLFESKVLRRNDISLLILDERWNSLFMDIQKPTQLVKCEERVRELLKEQARLIAEEKEISIKKKQCMDKIIQSASVAHEQNTQDAQVALEASKAQEDIQYCERNIKAINKRFEVIRLRLDEIPDDIKLSNLELLEVTVSMVYFKIASNRKRAQELEKLIMQTRDSLKQYIDEKETLTKDGDDIYTYFHDLLGAEELERLDKMYFN